MFLCGEAQGLFPEFKKNTTLANSGNLGITHQVEVQSSKKNTHLCVTKFHLVLVLFSFFKPSSQAWMVPSESDSGFLGSLDTKVNMFQNIWQTRCVSIPVEAKWRTCVPSLIRSL